MNNCAEAWNDAEENARKALHLYNDNKFEEALGHLETAIDINPHNDSWLFNKGLILNSLEQYENAIMAFQRANELNPDDPTILNSLGIDYTRTEQYNLALETFEELQRIAPDFEPGYCSRIIVYTQMGQHEKAETMFYLARQLKEDCELCYYNIGNSFFAREDYDQAIRYWEKAKSINPELPQIKYGIRKAYWAKGDKYQAKKHIVAELGKNSTDVDILSDYAFLLLEMDELEQANGILRFILELEPDNEHAYHRLGELKLHEGYIHKAIQNFQRALKIEPTLEGTNYRLGQCYLQLGQVINAKAHLLVEMKRKAYPTNPDLPLDLGALLYEMDLINGATHCFLRAIDLNPNDPRTYHNLSCCSYSTGSIKNGIDFSLAALQQDSKHLPSLENLINAYLYNGETEKGKEYMKIATKYWPRDKKLRSLKRKIRLSKLSRIRKSIFGSHSTNIAKRMRKTMHMEYSNIRWYPHYTPSGKIGRFRDFSLMPPIITKMAEWRR